MVTRPIDLHDKAILWYINRVAFHPRGYSLAWAEDGELYLLGDGDGTWQYDTDEAKYSVQIKTLMP